MFSGIVECQSAVLKTELKPGVLTLTIERPQDYTDLKPGDSIAVDGVCLTVEALSEKEIQFALGLETLSVTGWVPTNLKGRKLNLERSLKLGDRLHGHITSGHIAAMGEVTRISDEGGFKQVTVEFPVTFGSQLTHKGSVAVNGVSLTINKLDGSSFEVGLIPETLRRTNLGNITVGARVTLEADQMAKTLRQWMAGPGAQP